MLTKPFESYLSSELDRICGKDRTMRQVAIYDYERRSDNSGLIELCSFTLTSGDSYRAEYWHHVSYCAIKQISAPYLHFIQL